MFHKNLICNIQRNIKSNGIVNRYYSCSSGSGLQLVPRKEPLFVNTKLPVTDLEDNTIKKIFERSDTVLGPIQEKKNLKKHLKLIGDPRYQFLPECHLDRPFSWDSKKCHLYLLNFIARKKDFRNFYSFYRLSTIDDFDIQPLLDYYEGSIVYAIMSIYKNVFDWDIKKFCDDAYFWENPIHHVLYIQQIIRNAGYENGYRDIVNLDMNTIYMHSDIKIRVNKYFGGSFLNYLRYYIPEVEWTESMLHLSFQPKETALTVTLREILKGYKWKSIEDWYEFPFYDITGEYQTTRVMQEIKNMYPQIQSWKFKKGRWFLHPPFVDEFLEYLYKEKSMNGPEDFYQLSLDDLSCLPGADKRETLLKALERRYPEYKNWDINKFQESTKQLIQDYIINQLNIPEKKDWNHIKFSKFEPIKDKIPTSLKNTHNLLTTYFPNYVWEQPIKEDYPSSYFKNFQNVKEYFENLYRKLEYKSLDDFYQLSITILEKNRGRALKQAVLNDLIPKLYPDHEWVAMRFNRYSDVSGVNLLKDSLQMVNYYLKEVYNLWRSLGCTKT
ncbi:hypothetical protein DLAC_08015 [Tieghemostelium lacteum]|uniref:Uncharacterized protein n=1 Tax=Tieghemostelium lacteum TaxID=361077 RepID=A0A151ZAZ0_TIELA|nr:hypothetical protein DLAC_08015 [Tieghemostelium lacteum]|eukprot:KYQ91109.1 hypothetical protein DLAC_08015 [Tieghemostelium lacteum]